MIQISSHFIHNTTITATPTNPYSKWQEEASWKKSTLVGISPKSPPDSCNFLVKKKIYVCLYIYHYSSTYLSILLIFANITTQRKPLRELAPYFPNHVTGTDTFGRDLIYKFLKVLHMADHYYIKT